MKIAVTVHAVKRYKERVQGADVMTDESVREVVREKVEAGFRDGLVRDHPTEPERRIIPFQAGLDMLFFSIGPNTSETIVADLAVIGVLYEKELGGKKSTGLVLGDVNPKLKEVQLPKKNPPRFILQIDHGGDNTIETYRLKDRKEVLELLERRRPDPEQVLVYELSDLLERT